ncbi:MAG: hypothetical protein OEW56_04520, partial [Gemmatimonadota bacterium]|nr:hypothetical protein [Gemmatimonadota bacterium]
VPPPAPPPVRVTAPAPGAARPAGSRPKGDGTPPDTAQLTARWPEVVEAIRARRPLVAAALDHAVPAGIDGTVVALGVAESDVHVEGLERNRAEVEKGLAEVFGTRLSVTYRGAAEPASAAAGPPESKRLDQHSDRGERLKAYRAKDQALDAMADALDLELLD